MIIDVILDRKDAEEDGDATSYNPDEAMLDLLDYAITFGYGYVREAIGSGDEEKMKTALVRYVTEEYGDNTDIKEYVRSVDWLPKK